jgi:hypothetical protein
VEKYCRDEQDTDDNMAHAHCVLDTEGYGHTLSIVLHTYWCLRRRLNVKFLRTFAVL